MGCLEVEGEPDPGWQVEVEEGELRQQPLGLALPVRQLTKPLTHTHQSLENKEAYNRKKAP